jgi:hypothetical protein
MIESPENDVLFANESLLKQLIAIIGEDGTLTKLVKSSSSTQKSSAKFGFNHLGMTAGREVGKSIVYADTGEYEQDCINAAVSLLSQRTLMAKIPNYFEALRAEKQNQPIRFVSISGYVSWRTPTITCRYHGDIVILNPREPGGILNQHVVVFDQTQNRAVPIPGTFCRKVLAITFWKDRFVSSHSDDLTECEAVLVSG